MKFTKNLSRVLSMLLIAGVIFTALDFSVYANASSKTTFTVTSVTEFSQSLYKVYLGTSAEEVVELLPKEMTVVGDEINNEVNSDGSTATVGAATSGFQKTVSICWSSTDYDANVAGEYWFSAYIPSPSDSYEYVLPSGLRPTMKVVVKDEIAPEKKPAPDPSVVDSNDSNNSGTNTQPNNTQQNTSQPSDSQPNSTQPSSTQTNNAQTNNTQPSSTQSQQPSTKTESKSSSSSSASTPAPTKSASIVVTDNANTVSNQTEVKQEEKKKAEDKKPSQEKKTEETPVEENKETTVYKSADAVPVTVLSKSKDRTEFTVGNGKAVIKMEKSDSKLIEASVKDDEELLRNILTDEQLMRVAEGATVNLKISADIVKDTDISSEDSANIMSGVEECRKSIPGLDIAGYVDISIYLQFDEEGWNYVSNTNKPVELIINVPESYKGLSSSFYILRLHDGKTTLFNDDDDNPDTITISTGEFSIYVIMYDNEAASEIEKTEKKEMSLLVTFVILLLVVLAIQLFYFFNIRKKLGSLKR